MAMMMTVMMMMAMTLEEFVALVTLASCISVFTLFGAVGVHAMACLQHTRVVMGVCSAGYGLLLH